MGGRTLELSDGSGFAGSLEVYHDLHCLVRIQLLCLQSFQKQCTRAEKVNFIFRKGYGALFIKTRIFQTWPRSKETSSCSTQVRVPQEIRNYTNLETRTLPRTPQRSSHVSRWHFVDYFLVQKTRANSEASCRAWVHQLAEAGWLGFWTSHWFFDSWDRPPRRAVRDIWARAPWWHVKPLRPSISAKTRSITWSSVNHDTFARNWYLGVFSDLFEGISLPRTLVFYLTTR